MKYKVGFRGTMTEKVIDANTRKQAVEIFARNEGVPTNSSYIIVYRGRIGHGC